MHLHSIEVENFRSLTKVSIPKFSIGANLLVGPNAVGKTTLLEAVRLNKALLAPRTQQEMRSVMHQLGFSSAHLPQQLNHSAIASDLQKKVLIKCMYKLSEKEAASLTQLLPVIARSLAAAQYGISSADRGNPALTQFMSSPVGHQAFGAATKLVETGLKEVQSTRLCLLHLVIDPKTDAIIGKNMLDQTIIATLENQCSPYSTKFSYFPADRAIPTGEIPIQLGSADAQQQMESHNSNPALKYQRLKGTIFAALVESEESRSQLEQTFKRIFAELLKEKEIAGFGVNRSGQASINIRDLKTGKTFDIDSLSSGEKGIIMTFLLISRAVEEGGLVLLDEPELHLNPAVCRDLLEFLTEEYLEPRSIQALICTHSPEILGGAMRSPDCNVFHMRKGGSVSLMRKQDQPEVAEAMKLLGTSEVEEMLYEALVFVEGPDDVEILETAFSNALSRVKFRELHGRPEIEKHIRRLQDAEKKGNKENISYFLFDRDRIPAGLPSTTKVKVKQWERYCLENYLLDPAVLFDTLRKEFPASKIPISLGPATDLFASIAKRQLSDRVVEQVYEDMHYTDFNMRAGDRSGKTFHDVSNTIFNKIEAAKAAFLPLDATTWKATFVEKCEALLAEREQEWSLSWPINCSGKQFFKDLYVECGIPVAPIILKRRLVQENKLANGMTGTESWKLLEATFNELLKEE
jgi:predicted ATPase